MVFKTTMLKAEAAEFAVAARLSRLGVPTLLAPRNFPGVDLFAISADNGRTVAIQVKAKAPGQQVLELGSCIGRAEVVVVVIMDDADLGGRSDRFIVFPIGVLEQHLLKGSRVRFKTVSQWDSHEESWDFVINMLSAPTNRDRP